jgi:hypothetical protein
MTVPHRRPKTQATSSDHPVPGTTEASAPPLPVPCTLVLRLLGPNDPDPGTADPSGMMPVPDAGTAAAAFPDPQTCPTCGRAYEVPFDPRWSGLLDLALQTREAASALVNVLEQEALP